MQQNAQLQNDQCLNTFKFVCKKEKEVRFLSFHVILDITPGLVPVIKTPILEFLYSWPYNFILGTTPVSWILPLYHGPYPFILGPTPVSWTLPLYPRPYPYFCILDISPVS